MSGAGGSGEEADAGIRMETLVPGDATHFPEDGNTVRMHYETFLGGDVKIDSSRDRKVPIEFRLGLGQVVKGLDIAVRRMSRGQRAKVTVPSSLAYGSRGYPPIIPPKATIVFDVELISFA